MLNEPAHVKRYTFGISEQCRIRPTVYIVYSTKVIKKYQGLRYQRIMLHKPPACISIPT